MTYWQEHFERRGMMIIPEARKIGDFLDGDAVIASSSSSHISTSFATPSDVGLAREPGQSSREPPKGKRPAGAPPAGAPVKTKQRSDNPRSEPQHNVQNGAYTTNRTNKPLCKMYQSDACSHGKDCKYAHQCMKCLGNHGSIAPTPCKLSPKEKSQKKKGGRA